MYKIVMTTFGILLMFVLYVCFLFVITATPPFSRTPTGIGKYSTVSNDFAEESRLVEALNTAEIDREVAAWNLQIFTSKRMFSDERLIISTPAHLTVRGQRSIPGKVPPEIQELLDSK
jgi:hypothetical protein